MDKGPKEITTKNINPTETAQLPYLQQGWGQAKNLYEQLGGPQYYPGQTLATPVDPNPLLSQGYNSLTNTAYANDQSLRPAGNQAFFNALSGTGGSPFANQMVQYALGQDPDQQALRSQAGQAIASGNQYAQALAGGNLGLSTLGNIAQGGTAGMQQLAKTLGGAYLDPSTNPYIRGVVDAAARPVTDAYQRATAPQTDYNFANAGRYGSGAMLGARSQNEDNLSRALAEQSTNIYGQNYANERARQDAAAQQYTGAQQAAGTNYGQQYAANQGAAATTQLAGLGLSRQNLLGDISAQQDAQSRLLGAQTSALEMYPSIQNAQYTGANNLVTAGQGLSQVDALKTQNQQALINDAMARYNYGQNQPWQDLSLYQKSIGQPSTASRISTSPNPANSTLGALSGLVGGVGLLDKLGGSKTLGSLFGGGASTGLSSALAGDAAMTAAGVPTLTAGLAGPVAAEAAGGSSAAAALPALAWIICTELAKQGRLPKRWHMAGVSTFANYPEIAKRGYWVWAIPSVLHLRKHPYSLYSRLLCRLFNWRAEDLAARKGVRGARKLWRGRAVTAALVIPCLVLGLVSKVQDWQSVYRRA